MRTTRIIPRHTKEREQRKEHLTNLTAMLARRGHDSNIKATEMTNHPITQEKARLKEKYLQSHTMDMNTHGDATTSDTSWHPDTETHTESEPYNGWSHGYPQ